MKKLSLTLLAAALAAFAPRAARADLIAFATSGGTGLNSLGNFNNTFGYTFTLASSVSVTQLGFYDSGANGLSTTIPVTIYDANGTSLASATVPTSGTETNSYLYATLATPVTLAPGTYTIAGYETGNDFLQTGVTLTPAGGVTFGAARSAGGNTYPTTDTFGVGGNSYFGPDFQFTAVAGGVPEPSTWALLGVGVAGLGVVTLRQRRAAAARA